MNIFCDVLLFASTFIWAVSAVPLENRLASTTQPPAPIVVPPSQYWDGDDGSWSSFYIRVGTPAQDVRVLVSTNSPETMVVFPLGCTTPAFKPYSVPSGCAQSRGGLFDFNQSSTWKDQGMFGINQDGVGFEANLGYQVDAEYGLETLGLGPGGADGPTLESQTVAAFASSTEPFYTGIFGLNTQPVNYSTVGNSSAPSYFTSLRSQSLIPGLSWSYTAGAKYQLKDGVYAQLIFGGYDSSRFVQNTASFTLAEDVNRDIVVAIQSISYSGNAQLSLLAQPVYAFIESTEPKIWLPEAACAQFEKAFGLSLDNDTGLYLINSTQQAQIEADNPIVTFTLGDTLSGGQTVNINLPFSAFILPTLNPFTKNSTLYFPLKKAANESQITLGRTFLQEAYLTVDYDRGNFSVSQCLWNEGAASQIQSILSPSYANITTPSDIPTPEPQGAYHAVSIGTGVIVGIAIVAFILVAGITSGLTWYFCCYRRRSKTSFRPRAPITDETGPSDSVALSPVTPSIPVNSGLNPVNEVEDDESIRKPPLSPAPKYENVPTIREYYRPESELDASEVREMPEHHDDRVGSYLAVNRIDSQRRTAATPEVAGITIVHELEGCGPETYEMDDEMSRGRLTPRTLTPLPPTPGFSPVTPNRPGAEQMNRHPSNVSNVSSPTSMRSLFTFLNDI